MKKNQKESIRCKSYLNDVLEKTEYDTRVIYQDADGAYVNFMGRRTPVKEDSEGLYYECKFTTIQPTRPNLSLRAGFMQTQTQPAREPNRPILLKYILVPAFLPQDLPIRYFVNLDPFAPISVRTMSPPPMGPSLIVAVYERTGRGPFRDDDGKAAWEYEYKGVQVR